MTQQFLKKVEPHYFFDHFANLSQFNAHKGKVVNFHRAKFQQIWCRTFPKGSAGKLEAKSKKSDQKHLPFQNNSKKKPTGGGFLRRPKSE